MSPRWVRRSLLALVVWSFLLRLGFASYGLGPERFYDERYSLENVRALLAPPSGSGPAAEPAPSSVWTRLGQRLRPANGWYPSLSYLPQLPVLAASEALYRATGDERFAIFEPDGFTPTAYWLCRALVALFGALTLVATFLLGRRLFGPASGPAVGLLAALTLSASPTHLRHSAMFKPDMLLTLLTLTVFLLTLRWAAGRRSLADETSMGAAAGAVVGLAAASKLLGAVSGLLPAAVAAVRAVRHRSWAPLAGLTTAGLAAVAVFLALNPFPALHAEYLERNLRIYGERAELEGLDRLSALRVTVEHLLSPGFHAMALGWVALAGLIALGIGAWRRRAALGAVLPGLIPLWVAGYVLLYAGTAAYPKPNNLLPVLPFTSLAAAWLAVTAGRALRVRLVRRWPPLERAPVRRYAKAVVILAAVLGLLVPLHLFAYRAAVPTTRDLVEQVLSRELRPFAGRTVLYEEPRPDGVSPPVLVTRRDAMAVRVVPDLAALDPEERRLADAEVFSGAATDADSRSLTVAPGWGRARGPRQTVRLHRWALVEQRRQWAEEAFPRGWRLAPPDAAGGGEDLWLSVQILVRDSEPPAVPPRLEVAGREIPLLATRLDTGGYVYGTAFTSRRFPWTLDAEIRILFSDRPAPLPAAPRPPVADILVWRQPVL